jgi:hypothetical protein
MMNLCKFNKNSLKGPFYKGLFYLIKQCVIIFCIFLGGCHYSPCRIEPIQSLHDIPFHKIQQGTLVVFDVDETLIQPVDTYLINEHTPEAIGFKKGLIQKYNHIKNWDEIASLILMQAQRPLLEPFIIDVIKTLKKHKVKVIACTAMNIGYYSALIPRLEVWRYHHLKSLGFEGSYENLTFELPSSFKGALFYKGILSSNLAHKGPVLGAFLDHIKMHPSKIMMIDDDENALQSIGQECGKRHILFKGYHYRKAHSKPWNEKLIAFQADYLINHKIWLNDDEVMKKMSLRKN